jgi:hypothetical protein
MSKNDAAAQMILYLLGDVSEEEQVRLEEQFFTDEDAYQQLRAIEDELRYDYAQGSLSPRERELFEKKFLTTPAERERVALAKSVMEKTLEHAVRLSPAPEPKVAWWKTLFSMMPSMPSTQFAGAVALLAVMVAGSLVLETTRLKNEMAGLEKKQQSSQTAMAGLNQELQQERERRQQLEKQSAPAPAAALNILAFALAPGLVRGGDGPKRLLVPAGTESVRLQLDVKTPQSVTSYRASLQNLDGVELWSEDVRGTESTVSATLPGRLLAPGDYLVELKTNSGGEPQRVGEYYFTVVR